MVIVNIGRVIAIFRDRKFFSKLQEKNEIFCLKLKPISHRGEGQNWPAPTDIANYSVFCLGNSFFLLFHFYFLGVTQILALKKCEIIGGPPSPRDPLKL